MRIPILTGLAALAVAACGDPEPPKPAAAPAPPSPVAQAPAAPPEAAPKPSADQQLLERVRKALRDAREVDGQGVSATVEQGAVSLFGTVPSAAERRKVERFVAEIDGVKSVVNKLVIVRGS